jgi:hypothetical protein
MTKGRPKLPDGELMVSTSIRMPKWLVDWYDKQGDRSKVMRMALEKYADEAGVDTV